MRSFHDMYFSKRIVGRVDSTIISSERSQDSLIFFFRVTRCDEIGRSFMKSLHVA